MATQTKTARQAAGKQGSGDAQAKRRRPERQTYQIVSETDRERRPQHRQAGDSHRGRPRSGCDVEP